MGTISIDEFSVRLDKIKEFVSEDIDRIMIEGSQIVEDMQRGQLAKGKNIEEETIQSGYSPGYAKRRKTKGLQTKFVDLKFTGEFYESLDLTPIEKQGEFNIISFVDYYPYLVKRYPAIIGLSEKNLKLLKELIIKQLNVSIKKYLLE